MGFLNKAHSNSLRGVAILLVLICHMMAVLFPSNIARLVTPFGGIGVAIFLILSGYGLSFSYQKSLDGFWKKRIVGTFLPYTLLFLMILPFKSYAAFSQFVCDYFTIQPIVTYYWYIGYLALWYLIFYFIHRFPLPKTVRVVIIAIISVCMIVFFDSLRAEQTFSFLIGCLIFKYKEKADRILTKRWVPILAFFVGLSFLVLKQATFIRNAPAVIFNLVQFFIKVPFALFFIVFVYYLMKVNFLKKILDYFGKYSYELYLIHSITILMFSVLSFNKYLVLLIFVASTVLASMLFFRLNTFISKKLLRR